MEKNWCVEVWGKFPLNCSTSLFYTKREADAYFKKIRRELDSTLYIFGQNTITDKNNPDNVILLTNLKEDFPS